MNSVQIKQQINDLVARSKEIVTLCKTEVREMNEDEEKEFNELKEEIEAKKCELKELQDKLQEYEDSLPEEETVEEEEKEEKNKRNKKMNKTLIKEIRNALNGNEKTFKVNAEKRAVDVATNHDHVIETEIEGILDPLYDNSVLTQLGCRWYTGLPMGDVQIPVMGKGSVGWETELAEAQQSNPTFTSKKLQPKRLTSYVDISLKLLAQDTIGVESAIRRDIVNAIAEKLQQTIFDAQAGNDSRPASITYGSGGTTVHNFKELVNVEAEVDTANIAGEKKYVLSNKAKAALRAMIKGTNGTGMVYENNEVDGTPAFTTSSVGQSAYIYGDFNYLAIGSWGDVEITVDPYTQATKGCVRLVVNTFFDFVKLRDEAFVWGQITDED